VTDLLAAFSRECPAFLKARLFYNAMSEELKAMKYKPSTADM